MKEAVDLAEAVRDMGYMPEQVQDFYPYAVHHVDLHVLHRRGPAHHGADLRGARPARDKAMQRGRSSSIASPRTTSWCVRRWRSAGRRTNLIGYTKHCLIRPVPPRPGETSAGGGHGAGNKGGKAHGGAGGAGKEPKGSKGHGGMSRAQNTAGRNRAAQGRQGANGGGRRN